MYQRLPEAPGLVNGSHVVLGLAMLPLGLVYAAACTLGGRWRLYFPWLGAGRCGGRDLAAPAGGASGQRRRRLFATIEGLLLLAFLAAAASGAVWFVAQGGDTAVLWRGLHGIAARSFAVLMLLHIVAVSLHLLDLVRD